MARTVRSPIISPGSHDFWPMPQLSDRAIRYKECVGNRLRDFPPNEWETVELDEERVLEPFQHRLRHDAESVFWLLLWWSMQIKPLPLLDKHMFDPIREHHWIFLTKGTCSDDPRTYFMERIKFPEVCHDQYMLLENLLALMASQLKGPHELLPDRNQEEYLHEAFQRLIFNFLCRHIKGEFITLMRSPDLRRVQ
jgi:hypothetical protein